ncbi:DUF6526 family protein [Hymenobacter jeollabukensis]|uniref:Uncharacterized protein n=1 Tax=Hymenobacter jeollabukensis TaxID=2025313 RepID=A0A5R8WUC2_9BACT|nr:DUF6526 family protein [Hymenobacter jeollabukensis]TLM95370.1 hypothetical protein FDY95_06160 [Hymenobacter jeollabukensis]
MAEARFTRRYYWPHHFVALPAAFIMLLYTGRRYWDVAGNDSEDSRQWFCLLALAALVLLGLVLLRQHYALTLQDRLARLEVRQRYFELTGQRFQPLEQQLSLSQILSLRFASDAELPTLAASVVAEKLAPADIRARIQNFQPDPMRV